MLSSASQSVNEIANRLASLGTALPPALQGLAAYRQFILYKLAPSTSRPGKVDKLPCDSKGNKASAHEPSNWLDYATAYATSLLMGDGYGVGFVFTESDPFFFCDIDSCLVGGQWSARAVELCQLFAGCAIEVSQSGQGLHIFGVGRPPAHSCRNQAHGLEFYTSGRFVALTGTNAVGSVMHDASAALADLVTQYFPVGESAPVDLVDGPVAEWRGPVSDEDLIRRAMQSKSAASAFGTRASFADLWLANVDVLARAFPDAGGRPYDASGADAALAQHLSFWTGKDTERMRRLMMLPANQLRRDKYEREDYLPRTILGAVVRGDVCQDKVALTGPSSFAGTALSIDGIELNGIESTLLHSKTQDSVSQIFESKQAGKLLFNHSRGEWMEWDGTRWKLETTQKAFDFVRVLSRAVNWGGASSLGSAAFCSGVEKLARASRIFAAQGEQFDCENYLLNTPAGTLDLSTGKMRAHDPGDKITKCTSASPEAVGDGAEFQKFMLEITCGDRDLIRFLQVSLGACLSGAIEDHYMLFWIGSGRNGKNTLGDLVEDILGDYARKISSSTLMAKGGFESHPTEIAQLQGIRLAVSSEVSDGDFWHESRIKELTGDATINARYMRENHFTFRRTHKHLIYGNSRPQLRSIDAAVHSRIKIVPFKASFIGKENKDLPALLRKEMGYVLQWLIEGHRLWLENGKKLPHCSAVEAESADYFASQSTPEMWLNERCEMLPTDDRPVVHLPRSGDLYRDYRQWKEARGEQPMSQTRWGNGIMRDFKKVLSKHGIHYRGLKLIPLFGPATMDP